MSVDDFVKRFEALNKRDQKLLIQAIDYGALPDYKAAMDLYKNSFLSSISAEAFKWLQQASQNAQFEAIKSVIKPDFAESIGVNISRRLYTEFIGVLRILQYIGYFIVVSSSLILIAFVGSLSGEYGRVSLLGVLISAIGCFVVYILTEGFVAIVDLLSHIEKNTRLMQVQK